MSSDPAFARLGPPARVDDDVLAFLRTTKFYRPGRPLNVHRVLSHHPPAARALNRFLDWGDEAVLSSRERRLLILRTSMRTRCEYEWNVHEQQGRRAGDVEERELPLLRQDDLLPSTWTARELALLRVADAVCLADTLDDAQWEEARAALASAELIECLVVVGYYRMCAGLINGLGIPDEGELDSSATDASPEDP